MKDNTSSTIPTSVTYDLKGDNVTPKLHISKGDILNKISEIETALITSYPLIGTCEFTNGLLYIIDSSRKRVPYLLPSMLLFLDWLRDSAYGSGTGKWLLRTTGDSDLLMTSAEIYKFWVENVNDK
jgi:hypothetical protein